MPTARRFLKFRLERWIQHGAFHQLLFVAAVVLLVAVLGGLVAWLITPQGVDPAEPIWWAFLRLTDPGYLGDDEGFGLRVVSTVVTVLGYVLFMGSLIAIMTQWLARTIRNLEAGLTPISMRHHIVVLGWTNRTLEIVHKLLSARGRMARFLEEQGLRKARIVIQASEVDAQKWAELRKHVGTLWGEAAIILRSGSSLQQEHLRSLDIARAAAVIVPGADFELGGAELADARVVKTLLSMSRLFEPLPIEERPTVVAEILDLHKVPVAKSALRGKLEVVASDAVISRLISQCVRHQRLAEVYLELITHEGGNNIYVRAAPELVGAAFGELAGRFPRALVIGIVRQAGGEHVAHLVPPPDLAVEPADLLVLVALEHQHCVPGEVISAADPADPGPAPAPEGPAASRGASSARRILLLGWSSKVEAILRELNDCAEGTFEVTSLSRLPAEERERALLHVEAPRVSIRHEEGDYSNVDVLCARSPASFDNVVFLASAAMASSEEADARTVLGYALLKPLLADAEDGPEILVELLDPSSSDLFQQAEDVMLVSPRLLSDLLAHVALRPELNAVYEALFIAGGAELTLRDPADYGLAERELSFTEIDRAARIRGEAALGILSPRAAPGERILLNPGAAWQGRLEAGDRLIALAR